MLSWKCRRLSVRLESLPSRSHVIRAAAGAVSAGSLNLRSITVAASPSDILNFSHLYPPETPYAIPFFILCPLRLFGHQWSGGVSFVRDGDDYVSHFWIWLFPQLFKILFPALAAIFTTSASSVLSGRPCIIYVKWQVQTTARTHTHTAVTWGKLALWDLRSPGFQTPSLASQG